jgi:hypothetical protein
MGYVPFVFARAIRLLWRAGNKKPQAAIATRSWAKKSQPQARESRLRLKRSSNRPPIRQGSQDMRVTGYELLVRGSGMDSRQQSSRILWKPKALFIEKLFMATSLRRRGPRIMREVDRVGD